MPGILDPFAAKQYFIGQGYTPLQAAAIAGRLQTESGAGLDPAASGDSGTSFGLAQWRGPRLQALQAQPNYQSPDAQLAFVNQEMNTTESPWGKALRAATTPEAAVNAVMGYERPQGWSAANPSAGAGYTKTLQNTDALNSGEPIRTDKGTDVASNDTNFPLGLLGRKRGGGLLGANNALPNPTPGGSDPLAQLNQQGGGWGPLLMNLGAGIASGSSQGWGAGIGAGLANASNYQQNNLERQLKLAELQQSIGYQNAVLELNQQVRGDAVEIRKQDQARKQAEFAGPIGMIASAAPQYQNVRSLILDPNNSTLSGASAQAFFEKGPLGQGINTLKTAILGAAKINGDNAGDLYDTMIPKAIDSIPERQAKLDRFENYMSSVKGSLGAGYPAMSNQLTPFDMFTHEASPSNPATTTAAKSGAVPVQAGAAGGQQPVRVSSPADVAKLPSGTPFITPDGRVKYAP
jgi:hypothetical protein